MKAGMLNNIIKILSPTISKNEYGEDVETYHVARTTRARVIHNNGSKMNTNDEMVWTQSKQFEVRMYVKVDERDLIEWQHKRFKITYIEDIPEYNQKVINTELLNE